MITKLTKEQWDKVPVYLEKWLAIGKQTEPLDKEKAKDAVSWAYGFAGEKPPEMFIFLDSPMACQLAANLIKSTRWDEDSQLNSKLESKLRSKLGSQLESQLNSKLESKLRSKLLSQLNSQLRSKLGSQLELQLELQLESKLELQLESKLNSQLRSKLESQLNSQLYSQLYSQLDSKIYSQLLSQLNSQLYSELESKLESQELKKQQDVNYRLWWSDYYGFYDFVLNEVFPERKEDFNLLSKTHDFLINVGYFVPFKNIVFISENPKEINMEAGQLHHEYKMSMSYRDGWGLYSFKGQLMPDWLFEKPKEELNPKDILEIQNVDIRTKAIEWYGLEHLLNRLDYDVLDEKKEKNDYKEYTYKLINLDLGYGVKSTYLYMENPSCNEKHVEGVKAKTVDEALRFRIPDRMKNKYGYKPALARA